MNSLAKAADQGGHPRLASWHWGCSEHGQTQGFRAAELEARKVTLQRAALRGRRPARQVLEGKVAKAQEWVSLPRAYRWGRSVKTEHLPINHTHLLISIPTH